MTIYPTQNITLVPGEDNTLITQPTAVPAKIVVSAFRAEFGDEVQSYETDHCQCITSSIIIDGLNLLITLVTQRNDIDEFITISVQYRNGKSNIYKIRFIR